METVALLFSLSCHWPALSAYYHQGAWQNCLMSAPAPQAGGGFFLPQCMVSPTIPDVARSPNIVIDTNVLVAALRSSRGASFRLLQLVGSDLFTLSVSVPLVLEYEEVLLRSRSNFVLNDQDIRDLIDYLCSVADPHEIFFLWRPILKDPGDDMVLELAVAAGCDAIITFNTADFLGTERFGIRVISPRQLLQDIGEIK